ncbi:hypothetical protein RHDC4_00065 [Rhodocyclaceae bacterium]|nr:hypothetical protein RHDC4_00065 [Rhodocyclaceae bacterium]
MEVKDALENIRKALAEVAGKGQTLVSTEALRQYLDGLEKDAGISSEVRKLQHESNLAQYKAGRNQSLEMFKSVIGFAQVALKTSLLVNGAASIALLTFIGNIWTKTQTAAVAKALSSSLALFAVGALAAALATVTTYITQWCYERPYRKSAVAFHIATVVLVLGSYAFFGYGIVASYGAFITHLAP